MDVEWKDVDFRELIQPDSILHDCCAGEVFELLNNINILVNDKESQLKQNVKKYYQLFKRTRSASQRLELTSMRHSNRIHKLEAHIRRATVEKDHFVEKYERETSGLTAMIVKLEAHIHLFNEEKNKADEKHMERISNLQLNVNALHAQIDVLSAQQETLATQNRINMANHESNAKTFELKMAQVLGEEQELTNFHETQVATFQLKIKQLMKRYKKLEHTLERKIRKRRSLNSLVPRVVKNAQVEMLKEKLEQCKDQLSVLQVQKGTYESELDFLRNQCMILRDKQTSLINTRNNLAETTEKNAEINEQVSLQIFQLLEHDVDREEKLDYYRKYMAEINDFTTNITKKIELADAESLSLQNALTKFREMADADAKVDRKHIESLRLENEKLQKEVTLYNEAKGEKFRLRIEIDRLQGLNENLVKESMNKENELVELEQKLAVTTENLWSNMQAKLRKAWTEMARELEVTLVRLEKNYIEERAKTGNMCSNYTQKIGSLSCLNETLEDQIQSARTCADLSRSQAPDFT